MYALSPTACDYIFAHDELVFARTTPEQVGAQSSSRMGKGDCGRRYACAHCALVISIDLVVNTPSPRPPSPHPPLQKLQIVRECKAQGHRVGVTGDGVNDAPALKAADVGIAMASGSEVARSAAAIVLLTDDFSAVAHSVREGRLIFANLRKVIAYQISAGSWSELLPVLACFFVGIPQPLSSFLMIIICCITDVAAAIALMYEPAETDIMAAPPRNVATTRLVTRSLIAYSYL